MRAIMTVIVLSMISMWLMRLYDLDKVDGGATPAMKTGAAINFIQYRQAVTRFAYYNKDAPDGEISFQEISGYLPPNWSMYPRHEWKARIDDGYIYVWGQADVDEIEAAKEMLNQSLSVGEAQNGKLMPHDIELPAFVSNGSLASVFGSARYKPNNKDYPSTAP